MFATLMKAFRPLDTTVVDAAIADAAGAHKGVQVRARALRMDVSCGDATAAIERAGARVIHRVGAGLRTLYCVDHDTPGEMQDLLGKL